MLLQDKVAIITGGGGAIGKAVSLKLAGAGAQTAVFDLIGENAERVAGEIQAAGTAALACAVDVSRYEAVTAAVEKVLQRFGRIDILVNCAGGSARAQIMEFYKQSMDVIDWMLKVNLYGALHCIRAVTPSMVEAKRGAIVNVASIVALGGKKGLAEYGAAKGGLIAATRSLAIELGPHNITINCVSPGLVNRDPVADEQAFAQRYSFVNRVCTQADIAHAVWFMVLPQSDFITGQNLVVDGGRSLGLKGD